MKKQDKNKKIRYLVFGVGQTAGFIENHFDRVLISKADVTRPDEIV